MVVDVEAGTAVRQAEVGAAFYQVAFRKRAYRAIDEPHQGRWCYGKTPMQTFLASLPLAQEKMLRAQ